MPRSARFRSKREFTVGNVTVQVGRRSDAPAVKMVMAEDCALIVDLDSTMDLADALDEAITAYEADPLLWT